MALSKKEVLKVATLSRIRLSDGEVERFASQLSGILGYVDKLRELDTGRGAAGPRPADPQRPAERRARPGLTPEEALAGRPESAGDFFRVPRVLDEEAGRRAATVRSRFLANPTWPSPT